MKAMISQVCQPTCGDGVRGPREAQYQLALVLFIPSECAPLVILVYLMCFFLYFSPFLQSTRSLLVIRIRSVTMETPLVEMAARRIVSLKGLSWNH